jgi:hypothetical protein
LTVAASVHPHAIGNRPILVNEVREKQVVEGRPYEIGMAHQRIASGDIPPLCLGAESTVITGNSDREHINTSYVERANLTMRMHMRRFTRLTNAFSKKFENHCHMVALYAVWYNFIRIHKTLRVTPAMEAGVTDRLFTYDELVGIVDEWEASQKDKES